MVLDYKGMGRYSIPLYFGRVTYLTRPDLIMKICTLSAVSPSAKPHCMLGSHGPLTY
jgi:hypothetical protein